MANYHYYEDKVICECGEYNYPDEDDYTSSCDDELICDYCEATIEFEVDVVVEKTVSYKIYKITPVEEEEELNDDEIWGA